MPKSAVIPDDPTEGAIVHAAVNGINETLLKGYVSAIEAESMKIEAVMEKARKDCQSFVDEIKQIKKTAAENQIPKGPLSAKLRERSLKRKADGCRDVLNKDQQAIFDEISAKLGDLPLFQHMGDEE